MPSVSIDADQLHALLHRVETDSRRMAELDHRLRAVEHSGSSSSRPPSLPLDANAGYPSSRRAVSPPAPAPATASWSAPSNAPATPRYDSAIGALRESVSVSGYTGPSDHHSPTYVPAAARPEAPYPNASVAATRVEDPGAPSMEEELEARDAVIRELRSFIKTTEESESEQAEVAAAQERTIAALKRQVGALQDALDASAAAAEGSMLDEADDDGSSPARLFRAHLKEKNAMIATLQSEVAESQQLGATTIDRAIESVRSEMAAVSEAAKAASVRHERESAQLEEHVALKQAQVAALEQKLERREVALADLENKHQRMERTLSHAEAQSADLRRELEAARDEARVVREGREHADSRAQGLKEELVAANRRCANDASAVTQLRTDNGTLSARCETLEARSAELQRACDAEHSVVASLRREVCAGSEREKRLEEALSDCKAQLAASQRTQREAETALKNNKRELVDAYEAFQRVQDEKRDVARQLEDSRRAPSASPAPRRQPGAVDVGSTEERISALSFARDMAQREAGTLRKQVEALTRDLEGATTDLTKARRGDGAATVRVLRDENAGLRQEVARLTVEWDRARDEVLSLQRRLRQSSI